MCYFMLPHHVVWKTVSINDCYGCAISGDNISITWLEKTRAISLNIHHVTWKDVSCKGHKFMFLVCFVLSFPNYVFSPLSKTIRTQAECSCLAIASGTDSTRCFYFLNYSCPSLWDIVTVPGWTNAQPLSTPSIGPTPGMIPPNCSWCNPPLNPALLGVNPGWGVNRRLPSSTVGPLCAGCKASTWGRPLHPLE